MNNSVIKISLLIIIFLFAPAMIGCLKQSTTRNDTSNGRVFQWDLSAKVLAEEQAEFLAHFFGNLLFVGPDGQFQGLAVGAVDFH